MVSRGSAKELNQAADASAARKGRKSRQIGKGCRRCRRVVEEIDFTRGTGIPGAAIDKAGVIRGRVSGELNQAASTGRIGNRVKQRCGRGRGVIFETDQTGEPIVSVAGHTPGGCSSAKR